MKKIYLTSILFLAINLVYSQISEYGIPLSFNDVILNKNEINTLKYNFNIIKAQNTACNDSAYIIGITEKVSIDFFSYSDFYRLNDTNIYLLKIDVNDARAVGLEFSDFYLPKNCELFVYNEDKTILYGAYTQKNNRQDSSFAIQPIYGTTLIIELNQPINNLEENPRIVLSRIKKYFEHPLENKIVGECFEDVHCVPNLDIERSVIKWEFVDLKDRNTYVCSCVLINQDVESNDVKPYLLTAKHCGKNADLSTAIFYFNYQHPDCNTNGGTERFTMVGATEKARDVVHDMFLMELDEFPPPDYNVFLAGWDREDADEINNVTGIHHPHGDEKSISLGTRQNNSSLYFWRVEWTENNSPAAGGSSGSPLFDTDNNRVIGWLSYGYSDCDNTDGIDKYGKLRRAWTNNSSNNRLRDWLDPDNNDNNNVDGRNPCFDYLLIENRTFFSAQLYQPENRVVIQATNTIETTGEVVISAGSDYVFQAGETIILGPGFSTEEGATFTAEIIPELKNKTSRNKTDTISIYKINTQNLFTNTNLQQIRVFPNPLSEHSTIEYTIPSETNVNIKIYDIQGNIEMVLIDNIKHDIGIFQIDLNADFLTQGIYFCVLSTDISISTTKLIISKN